MADAREFRILREQPARLMCKADGWVMVRFPRCIPFTMQEKEWNALPVYYKASRKAGGRSA